MSVEPSGRVAEIAASPPGPQVGAFFDLDGTLVSGFTATAHAGDRIRRRQARIGEVLGVLEASIRYRLGRMQFERLILRAAGYLKGESLRELDELGERLFVRHIASRVYPNMREIVEAHRQRGHTIALCSSALTIHAEPVARALGITQLLCNHFEVDENGVLTGGIEKPVIWGARKADAAQKFCADNGVDLAEQLLLCRRRRGRGVDVGDRPSSAGEPAFGAGRRGRGERLAGAAGRRRRPQRLTAAMVR